MQNNAVQISIVTPIYNAEGFLGESLGSLLSQRMKDLEIILINDASPDRSAMVAEQWREKDPRIHLIQHPDRLGQAAARNSGIRAAKGRYIFFMDADDLLYDELALWDLFVVAEASNADECLGLPLKWNPDTNECFISNHRFAYHKERHSTHLGESPLLASNVAVWSKLFRRDFILENNLFFDEELLRCEDNPFSWMAHTLAKSVSISQRPTYLYRQRQRRDRPGYDQDAGRIKYILMSLRKMTEFFDIHPESSAVRPYIEFQYHSLFRTCCLALEHSKATLDSRLSFLEEFEAFLRNMPAESVKAAAPQVRGAGKALRDGDAEAAWRHLKQPYRRGWLARRQLKRDARALERKLQANPHGGRVLLKAQFP